MVTKSSRTKARAATRRASSVKVPDAARSPRQAGAMHQMGAQFDMQAKMHLIGDGLTNLMSGMGTDKEKLTQTFFNYSMMSQQQMDIAYKGDWIARKAVDIPAADATREWRSWQGDPKQITAIEGVEKLVKLQRKTKLAMQWARLYGGAGLVLGVDGAGTPEQELDFTKVKQDSLKWVHVVTRHDLSIQGQLIDDPSSPWYGEPEMYNRTTARGETMRIHPSRVVRFVGYEAPDWRNTEGWGDSVLQVIADAVRSAGTVTQGVAQLVAEAKVDIVKIPGLSENMKSDEYQRRLRSRFANASMMKSIFSTMLTDKEEEWTRLEQNFSGLPDILQMYLLIACAAVDIPATRFLSQSPAGLSSTGEADLRNYYDKCASDQDTEVTPTLERADNVVIMSALGTQPEELFYEWRPLWQMTPTEAATIAVQKSVVMTADVNAALMSPAVLQQARQGQLIEDGTYPGLEHIIDEFGDDVEERQQEEADAEAERLAAQAAANPIDPNGDGTGGGNPPPNGNADPRKPVKTKAGVSDARSDVDGTFATGIVTKGAISGADRIAAAARKHGRGSKAHRAAIKRYGNVQAQSMADRISGRMVDASSPPRPLYIRRDVINQKDIKSWAKKAGFKSSLDDMHVTVVYSKGSVDWLKAAEDSNAWGEDANGNITINPGGPRVMQLFGQETDPRKGAIVLSFANTDLAYRHRSIGRQEGATYDFDDYTPHITITYQGPPDGVDVTTMQAYQGKIVLGPEVWEEVVTGGFNPTPGNES